MTSLRKYSLVGGIFYLLTFVSIPTLALYGSVRAPNFVAGPGPDTPVIVGVLLEMIVALAGIGSAGLVVGQGLAAQYKWSFFFSQSFIPGISGVLLGSLLYQSRLVPRWLPVLAFIGAPLLVAWWFAVLAGANPVSPGAAISALPIAVWEFSLGIYLTFWGFRSAPILSGP